MTRHLLAMRTYLGARAGRAAMDATELAFGRIGWPR